ncbi:hypothetical protein BDV26DRAFT_274477 [Aspergillus bertholletiae]|uniref:Uncharacterized protein n=1 Tax=Aspergillus bertholletiae TaxID=1226010 RepID=A0A5N7ATP1_9EURO|nr:hypothetical protein BDV26DRAFT_274477 [Aspergillus bertholletiae]
MKLLWSMRSLVHCSPWSINRSPSPRFLLLLRCYRLLAFPSAGFRCHQNPPRRELWASGSGVARSISEELLHRD